jgi:membrane protein required for beta-lactamase induction
MSKAERRELRRQKRAERRKRRREWVRRIIAAMASAAMWFIKAGTIRAVLSMISTAMMWFGFHQMWAPLAWVVVGGLILAGCIYGALRGAK